MTRGTPGRAHASAMLVVAGLLALGAAGLSTTRAAATTGPQFSSAQLPPAPGLGLKQNEDGEPGLAVAPDGTVWVASDIAPYAADDPRAQPTGVLSGADIWSSSDRGRTYQWKGDPFAANGNSSSGLGGEDTDIAVAPVKNANGFYNVYVASLWVGATTLATSQDGGATWTLSQLSGLPIQDRPWLSADNACTVFLSYHEIATYDTFVNRYDVCTPTNDTVAPALNPVSSPMLAAGGENPGFTNRFGKQVVDTSAASPHQHNVYVPMEGCEDSTANPPNGIETILTGCTTPAEIQVAVSTDGGQTYNDVAVTPTGANTVYIWPDTMAVDSAGNVYIAWFNGQNSFLNVSHDGGLTWSKSIRINQAPSLSSVYPTLGAGQAGHIVVAWYGTERSGDSNDVSVMGQPNAAGATVWSLYFAESFDGGTTFTQTVATGPVHTGTLCTEGGGCGTYAGDRNLLDDFGVAVNPVTGLANVAFTNDQPGGAAGTTHTDFLAQQTSLAPPATVPESPTGAAGLVGLGLLAAGMVTAMRRRRTATA